jgi:hypothetical protein
MAPTVARVVRKVFMEIPLVSIQIYSATSFRSVRTRSVLPTGPLRRQFSGGKIALLTNEYDAV